MCARGVQAAAVGTVQADVLLGAIPLVRRRACRVAAHVPSTAAMVALMAVLARRRRIPWKNQRLRIKAIR